MRGQAQVQAQVLILAFGGSIGPLLQLITINWLARLYTASDFGDLAVFLSVTNVLITVICLRYEYVINKVDDQYLSASTLLAIIAAVLASLLIALFLLVDEFSELIFKISGLSWMTWGVPVFCMCAGVILVGLQVSLRRAEFGVNALFRSSQTVVFLAAALLFDSFSLVNISIFSNIIVSLVVVLYLYKTMSSYKLSQSWCLAKQYKYHPIFLVPTSFFDAAALAAPIYFISQSYGNEVTGSYFQAQKIAGAPLALVAMVTGQLFLKKSSELYRCGKSSRDLLWNCFCAMGLVSFFEIILLYIGGEYVFTRILGDGWRVDDYFLTLVTLPLAIRLCVSPVSNVFITHNEVVKLSIWQFSYFSSTLGVLYFATVNFKLEEFLIIYATHELIAYSIYLLMANSVARGFKDAKAQS
jgi:O-antigen/teichoic acid export membrane protein